MFDATILTITNIHGRDIFMKSMNTAL